MGPKKSSTTLGLQALQGLLLQGSPPKSHWASHIDGPHMPSTHHQELLAHKQFLGIQSQKPRREAQVGRDEW